MYSFIFLHRITKPWDEEEDQYLFLEPTMSTEITYIYMNSAAQQKGFIIEFLNPQRTHTCNNVLLKFTYLGHFHSL